MVVNPGDVVELPADDEAGEDEDKGPRPHIVLTRPEPLAHTVTLIYCSKSDLETRVYPPPPYLFVQKGSPEWKLGGFKRYSPFIYPNRLVMATQDEVTPESRLGVVPDLLTQLRDDLLMRALGVGTGTTREPGLASGSPRGAVAELTELGRKDFGCRYVLVVAAPAYGRVGVFWNVIPITPRGGRQPADPDFSVSWRLDWVRQILGSEDAILFVRLVRHLYKPTYVRTMHLGADADTMQRVDQSLMRHFESQTGAPGSRWVD